jgi:tetratricopeptide (TPR) repeat protein
MIFKLLEAFPKDEKDTQQVKVAIEKVSKVLQEVSDFSDGYFIRAVYSCTLNGNETEASLKDINTAISTHAARKSPGLYDALADSYSLVRAKLNLDKGRYREALDDLEAAMKQNVAGAEKLFNSDGNEPDTTASSSCGKWNLSDLDGLIQKAPKDFRAPLFRGLYLSFFADSLTFSQGYFQQALQDFQHSALINPHSPLPPYYTGRLYEIASYSTNDARASVEVGNEVRWKAIQAYTKAIQLDPKFPPAYERRADLYWVLERSREAIADYDKVIGLDRDNASAYAGRAKARVDTKQYLAATFDFGKAITIREAHAQTDRLSHTYTLEELYERRGDAYIKLGMYKDAIESYSKKIKEYLGIMTYSSLNLKQIRSLYPEYDGVSDEGLVRKINALFGPELEYSVIAKRLIEGKGESQFLYGSQYEHRGDAYLRLGDFRRGVLDFNRIFKGIPDYANALERWRLLGATPDGQELYLDVKTAVFASSEPSLLWLKTVGKAPTHTVEAYEVDCKLRRINQTSAIVYDADGKILRSSDASRGWQPIVPDSMGEQLYNGMCSGAR